MKTISKTERPLYITEIYKFIFQGMSVTLFLTVLSVSGQAQSFAKLTHPVWGCTDPNVAFSINDPTNSLVRNSQWLQNNRSIGKCSFLSAKDTWSIASKNYKGLTFIRKKTGDNSSPSFWVPTSSLITVVPVPKIAKNDMGLSDSDKIPVSIPLSSIQNPATESPLPTSPNENTNPKKGIISIRWWIIGGILLLIFCRRRYRKHRRINTSNKTYSTTNFNKKTLSYVPDKDIKTTSIPPLWYKPRTPAKIGHYIIPDGMVYIGNTHGQYGNYYEASVINPRLAIGNNGEISSLPYWPSYSTISPASRKLYLEWLCTGKKNQYIDIGYVFLYFYGLEKRLMLEEPHESEVNELLCELGRLLRLYQNNNSFDTYCSKLINAVHFLKNNTELKKEDIKPNFFGKPGQMSPNLKVILATEIKAERPLSFDLSASALLGLTNFYRDHLQVINYALEPFLYLLKMGFEKKFPFGLTIKNRKNSKLSIIYKGANAGLEIDLALKANLVNLPDPETLTWTKLSNLAHSIAVQLTPLATLRASYPHKANSLASLIGCPQELYKNIAPEAQRWIADKTKPTAVPFGILAKHAIGAENKKWTIRHRKEICETLLNINYIIEPPISDKIVKINDDTIVFISKGRNISYNKQADIASLLFAEITKNSDEKYESLDNYWIRKISEKLNLSYEHVDRLRLQLFRYRNTSTSSTKLKNILKNSSLNEQTFYAWSAIIVFGITDKINKKQITTLEFIYDALNLPRRTLYTELHSVIANSAPEADEPVIISNAVQESVSHTIPRSSDSEITDSGVISTDIEKLSRIRTETSQVSALLADIFVDNEDKQPHITYNSDNNNSSLDDKYIFLLKNISSQPNLSRQEFDSMTKSLNLMADGALETINEWSFDHYDEAIIEDGDPLIINEKLLNDVFQKLIKSK